MLDRTVKILLSCCFVVLLALLLRPQFTPAFGQSPPASNSGSASLLESKDGNIYVVANNKLSVWKPGPYVTREDIQNVERQAADPKLNPEARRALLKVVEDEKRMYATGMTMLDAKPLP